MGSEIIEDILLLYVEDDSEIRTVFERFLRRRVRNVIVAANGQEGYDMYTKHKPDLIITDIQMPIMSGLEMCSIIRDENTAIPIIVTTAHSETQFFQEAINLSINMFLLKPIDSTQLYNTIKITAENILLKVKSEANKQLVIQRTLELEQSNKELSKTINNLKEIQKELVASENMANLGGLVAGIAHEINTPVGVGLTGITHFLELTKDIKNKYKSSDMSQEEFEEYLLTSEELASMINTNLERTAQLVRSFKQVAVDQSSEIKRVFNPKEYTNEILLSIRNIIKKTKLDISIIGKDNLKIKSYPGAFSQIITNLIINSIKHGYKENDKGTIQIDISKENNNLNIIYKDDGKGISKENLPKIFDLFFTTSRKSGGTGLGLNIIYTIITSKLNGTIVCESKKGKGVTFTVSIPLDYKK